LLHDTVTSPVTAPARPGHVAAALSRWGTNRGQLPPIRCQPLPASPGQADGLIRL